jgi:hypothetical protein
MKGMKDMKSMKKSKGFSSCPSNLHALHVILSAPESLARLTL